MTEPLRFFDFGNSYWAHPFSSLYADNASMTEYGPHALKHLTALADPVL